MLYLIHNTLCMLCYTLCMLYLKHNLYLHPPAYSYVSETDKALLRQQVLAGTAEHPNTTKRNRVQVV